MHCEQEVTATPKVFMATKVNKRKKAASMGRSLEERNDLIEKYQRYVHAIVGKMIRAMNLPAEMHDDFVSAGYLGLIDAAERYDQESGIDFKVYAYLRIRGAVIDYIRSTSNLYGKAYRASRALGAAQSIREEQVNALSSSKKKSSNTSLAEIMDFAAKGAMAYRMSWADAEKEVSKVTATTGNPEGVLVERENDLEFRKLVETLPEKERLIIEDYYFKGRSFTEIAESYEGFSKSWVSRLHTRALDMLKQRYLLNEKRRQLSEEYADM